MLEQVLTGFGEYVRSRGLAPERQVPYMVGWVRGFLEFARGAKAAGFEGCLTAYLEELRACERRADWRCG